MFNKKDTFYVTTPIFYVNAKPHIGHSYTTILADVLYRYNNFLLCNDSYFLTGTDEHGLKIQKSAHDNNISPIEQCNYTSKRFSDLWNKLDINYTDFIRTTEIRHKAVVLKILEKLYNDNLIYKSEYNGWYCISCERFFTKKDIKNNINCILCGKELEEISEENYFFRMSKYREWLIKYIFDNKYFILPQKKANETLGFLKEPLNDLCISRPKKRVNWGIELPFDNKYTCYVWVDALFNYISTISYFSNVNRFKKWWPPSKQLIGKDILITHTIYWPILLKALNIELPKTIFVHGWWLVNSEKMSKSSNNFVDPINLIDKYGVDAFRYFLISEMVSGHDADFSETIFICKYNTDLVNSIGNLVNRILKFLIKYNNGIIPVSYEDDLNFNIKIRDNLFKLVVNSKFFFMDIQLNKFISSVLKIIKLINEYIECIMPWKLLKDKNFKKLDTVMFNLIESIRIIMSILYPIIPNKAYKIMQTLNINIKYLNIKYLTKWNIIKSGTKIAYKDVLFPKI